MEIASLILSVISLCLSIACIVLMLSKNFFSTHQVQMVPVDPFKDGFPPEIGKSMTDPFRELGDPIDSEELERIAMMRAKKGKMS